ncbi:hypothetical protein HRQ91_06125 [Treponema parvum]|uniref:Capsule assembly protein Wzi n=1 Tax=Treponema parvum TaxID=138851 RepID=A0A975F428_9SPIR|nr:capsule assembly Wzi family protein [Treponema parvum]QTQ14066.1 hypothetical protein HRQ91_06125 [Treponema parvum]
MYKYLKRFGLAVLFFLSALIAYSQEALKSYEEEYYDFLSLQGLVERPTLNYRTLSDSVWELSEETQNDSRNIWKDKNLGTTRFIDGNKNLSWKIHGPEWYNSFNTAAPYGQNDGALWQGKGYNTSLSGGAGIGAYGFQAVFLPQLSFSQNKEFDFISPSVYSGNDYKDKADTYGYYGVTYSLDAPQRFGDKSFAVFNFGDSEIRYTWKALTLGLGTQAVWLGPAQLNPIIHSNNAPNYPKVDFGVKKTSVYWPWSDRYLGDIEIRGWFGRLTESDYFDNIDSNDHNLISGLALAWAPPHLTGLTLGVNRTMLSRWNEITGYSLFRIYNPLMSGSKEGSDNSDQRISFTADYLLPSVGFEIYFEWARNDFSPNLNYISRYPFHTQGYTLGGRKNINFSDKYSGELSLEITNLECSRDYNSYIPYPSTFYAHHIITQGYTNGGQWLGAGIGTGGNSQYMGFKLYHPNGFWKIFFQRRNPDLDYTWHYDVAHSGWGAETNIRVLLIGGMETLYYLSKDIYFTAGLTVIREKSPLNNGNPANRNGLHAQFSVKYNF